MHQSTLSGLSPILHTPFHRDGTIDEASFEKQVAFCLAARCDALVFPSMASEFYTLEDSERTQLSRAAIQMSRHNGVPVIIGVTSVVQERAAALAADAAAAGATALLSLPEYPRIGSLDQTISYFSAVAAAAPDLPIVFQNPLVGGSSLYGVRELEALLNAVPAIRYIKEEGQPSGPAIRKTVDAFGPRLDGVYGGSFGLTQTTDALYGATGSMPGVGLADRQVAIQRSIDAGEIERAREQQARIQPVLDFMRQYLSSSEKLLMHMRGIFTAPRVRDPQAIAIDEMAEAEFRRLLTAAEVDLVR